MDRTVTRKRIKEWNVVRKHRFRTERRIERLKGQLDTLAERESLLEERICVDLERDGPLPIDTRVYTFRVEEAFGDTCRRIDVQLTDKAAGRIPFTEVA